MTRQADVESPLSGSRVLIAEDEVLVAFDLQDLVEGAGAKVVGPFQTEASALKAAMDDPITIALLDIHLGRTTTHRIAAVLRARDIPFAVYTAQSGSAPDRAGFGKVPILEKPSDYIRIVETLARMVRPTYAEVSGW